MWWRWCVDLEVVCVDLEVVCVDVEVVCVDVDQYCSPLCHISTGELNVQTF